METNYFEDRLIKKDIKKVKREYIGNIFSTKLNINMIKLIMKYLDIKYLYEFAKTSIYIFNIFIDYENFVLYKSLKEKAEKNICKIILKENKQGFGYFIKISDDLKILFINKFLTEEEEEKNKIKIIKENKEKEIDLNDRTIYSDLYDSIYIIEILENRDNIYDFFDYDNDTSKLNINDTLCIFNTNTNEDENIIYGELKSQKMDIINYVCQSNNKKDSIYQYSPILNLSNNKIIGFHDKYNKNDNNNVGILFKLYINGFKRENIIYKNKEKFNNKGVFKRIFR